MLEVLSQPTSNMTNSNCSQNCPDAFDAAVQTSPIVEKLRQSSLFSAYRDAFQAATGLSLELCYPPETMRHPCRSGAKPNAFCRAMREDGALREVCRRTKWDPAKNESAACPRSAECFAGLRISTVPVTVGNDVVAHLRTAPVPTREPSEAEWAAIRSSLSLKSSDSEKEEQLKKPFWELSVVDEARYRGAIGLLTAFAAQLGELANRLTLSQEQAEPTVVAEARRFILENLEEKLTLDMVADHVNVSPFYFCKIFKRTTGLSFTEFVNRSRVEWAKKRLKNPNVRITEVAYDVGYHSLSQFNRCFLKYAGESPTRFRERLFQRRQTALAA